MLARCSEQVILHALTLGSPPAWDDVPPELQLDIAGLDKLADDALWTIAKGRKTEALLRWRGHPVVSP